MYRGGIIDWTKEELQDMDWNLESKKDMLSGSQKENVIEEGETKEEFSKMKRDERKKTLDEGKLLGQFVEKTLNTSR